MPLYDANNPMGWEAHTLAAVWDYLAECEGAQAMARATGSAEEKKATTLAKIVVGPQRPPSLGPSFTIDELKEQGVEFQLFSPQEGGKGVLVDGMSDPSCGGEFKLITRKYLRDEELVDLNDTYLGTVQEISGLEEQLSSWMKDGREGPRLKGAIRELGPSFGEIVEEGSQGAFIEVQHSLPWGDFGAANQE